MGEGMSRSTTGGVKGVGSTMDSGKAAADADEDTMLAL